MKAWSTTFTGSSRMSADGSKLQLRTELEGCFFKFLKIVRGMNYAAPPQICPGDTGP